MKQVKLQRLLSTRRMITLLLQEQDILISLKDEQIEAIKELEHLEEIIFFFDGDDARVYAVKKYAEQLHQLCPELTITTVNIPEEEDINSIFLKYGKDVLLQLIGERTALYGKTIEKTAPLIQAPQEVKSSFDGSNPKAVMYQNEHLHITVLGGIKVTGLDQMKVTLKVQLKNSNYQHLRCTTGNTKKSSYRSLMSN